VTSPSLIRTPRIAMPSQQDDRPTRSSVVTRRIWGGVMLLLCGWVAVRMGAFDLSTRVSIDGRSVDVLNMYGTVDHPFHATRAATLLASLQDGEILRWMGHHQGGYPVEFYPLGIPWVDVAIWAISFGSIPILAAHKLTVILIFLLPALSFWLLARGDRIHPAIAVLAAAVHFAVPGHWLNGGYEELVGWGLVTNVAGASLAFLTSVALARFVLNREFGMGILATLAAAGGAVTNPRSLFALVVAALAILLVATVAGEHPGWRSRLLSASVRIAGVGGIAALLAAPVIMALFRYNASYFFLHYEFYEPLQEYWHASATAVTEPVLLLAVAGAVVALLGGAGIRLTVSRALAAAGAGYTLLTLWVVMADRVPPLVEQLEAPRLMPYQRQLMVWFGALAVGLLAQHLARIAGRWSRDVLPSVLLGVLAGVFLIAHVQPFDAIPQEEIALREVSTTGTADHANFERAVERAEDIRPDGTAVFVIGNQRDDEAWWHQQLWAPSWSDARFYYDDWMWYWHDDHAGPYDPADGYWFPNPTQALDASYLDANAIGVVVITDVWVSSGPSPREAARTNPHLSYDGTIGVWDIYSVNDPLTLVTNGDALPASIDVGNQEITASFDEGDGTIVIRQNWFPRWTATVNGEDVDIIRRNDGYMELNVPAGAADVRLEYAVTGLDWVARGASVAGGLLLLAALWRGRRTLHHLDTITAGQGANRTVR
jgi:hypothetical protein